MTSFDGQWDNARQTVTGQIRKGFNSLIILLGAWSIWNHCNCCVCDGISPSLAGVMSLAAEELQLWDLAGARGISHLHALVPDEG